jgi:type II secretory pathway component PulJ
MMVTVALLLLIMTVVVQIFASATGAISASRAYQELNEGLRRLDVTIRSDLGGVTARLTPPLDPKDNLGYFEYGENAFADNQGEDADDYLRFTAKAPEGRPFAGRVMVGARTTPTLITSQYAEVIYFLRGGNLYRRVLLIAPERQASLRTAVPATFHGTAPSWQGVNDLSAHPSPTRLTSTVPILNTLGDLTDRENRAFSPRFFNDNWGATAADPPDGVVDDLNAGGGNGVPDYYPTLYPNAVNGLTNEVAAPARPRGNYGLMPFPYIFPGAYSKPAPGSFNSARGWIHGLDPADAAVDPTTDNQAPLESGDSAPRPGGLQTWWGFPTWRETSTPTGPIRSARRRRGPRAGIAAVPADRTPRRDGREVPPPRGRAALRRRGRIELVFHPE